MDENLTQTQTLERFYVSGNYTFMWGPSLVDPSYSRNYYIDRIEITSPSGSAKHLYAVENGQDFPICHVGDAESVYTIQAESGSLLIHGGSGKDCEVEVKLQLKLRDIPTTVAAADIVYDGAQDFEAYVSLSNPFGVENFAHEIFFYNSNYSSNDHFMRGEGFSIEVSVQNAASRIRIPNSVIENILKQFPNNASIPLDVCVYTFRDSINPDNVIGSYTYTTITLSLTNAFAPTLEGTDPSHSIIFHRIHENDSYYLTNRAEWNCSCIAIAKLGARIKSYTIVGPGLNQTTLHPTNTSDTEHYDGNYTCSISIQNLTATISGNQTFSLYVTDTREFTSYVSTGSQNYYAYFKPKIEAYLYRDSENPTVVKGYSKITISLVSECGNSIASYGGLAENGEFEEGTLAESLENDYTHTVTDRLGGSSTVILRIGTANVFMRFDKNLKSIGFGAYVPSDEDETTHDKIYRNSIFINQNWKLFTHGKEIIDLIHPVGSYYISNNNTSPATLFPGTTWTRLTGCFLVAASNEISESVAKYQSKNTGGAASQDISNIALPEHSHYLQTSNNNHSYSISWGMDATDVAKLEYVDANGQPTGLIHMVPGNTSATYNEVFVYEQSYYKTEEAGSSSSSSTTIDTIPPYKAVFIWYRTA